MGEASTFVANMRIALVISSLRGGGAERVAALLANAWVSRGHEVQLITLSDAAEAATSSYR